jgi:hypothetical protein
MKSMKQNLVILVAIVIGSVIGVFKGHEAKQKFIFKWVSNADEKQHLSELKKEKRAGKLLLDDIEMAAFHKA